MWRETIEGQCARWWGAVDGASRRALAGLVLLSLLAWGGELVEPTFAVDDYGQSLKHNPPHWTQLGRWAADLLHYHVLGGWFAPTLHLLLGLVLNALAVLLVLRLWQPGEESDEEPGQGWRVGALPWTLAGALFLTFPYLCDAYNFNTGAVATPLANLLVMTGYARARGTREAWLGVLGGGLCVMVALALYQAALNFLAVAVVFQLLFALLRGTSLTGVGHVIRRQVLPGLMTVLLGIVFYGVSVAATFQVWPRKNPRWQQLDEAHRVDSLADVGTKLADVARFSWHHLNREDVLFSASLKRGLTVLVLGAVIAALASVWLGGRRRIDRSTWTLIVQTLGTLLLSACAFVAVYSTDLGTLRSLLGVGYRHTYPLGLVYAGFFLLLVTVARPLLLRNLVVVAGCVLLLRFVAADNAWAFAQRRMNDFDAALADRIVRRIEAHPGFRGFGESSVAFVGLLPHHLKPRGYALLKGGRLHGSLNHSALQAPWAIRNLLRTRGVEYRSPTERQQAAAAAYARQHRGWPHADAVRVQGKLVIVVLGPPRVTAVR